MNIAQVLKAEISRISKKEAKALTSSTRSTAIQLKKTASELKNRVSVLEKEIKRLSVLVINLASTQPAPAEDIRDADRDHAASNQAVTGVQAKDRKGFLPVSRLFLTSFKSIFRRPDEHISRFRGRLHAKTQEECRSFFHSSLCDYFIE